MLRLSKKADYALIAMNILAVRGDRGSSSARTAGLYDIPIELMAKVLQRLVRRGLLVSQQGTRGGYQLSRAPIQITVADVIQAIEGPVTVTACSTDEGQCEQFSKCNVRDPLYRVREKIYPRSATARSRNWRRIPRCWCLRVPRCFTRIYEAGLKACTAENYGAQASDLHGLPRDDAGAIRASSRRCCRTSREQFGNAASRSHAFGWKAEEAVDERARADRRAHRRRDAKEIVFTTGATESDNLAIKGVAEIYCRQGQPHHHGA